MKDLISYIKESGSQKQYYIGAYWETWKTSGISLACGPYSDIKEAKDRLKEISSKCGGLKGGQYDETYILKVYRASVINRYLEDKKKLEDVLVSEEEFINKMNESV